MCIRDRVNDSPDGLAEKQGAFLLCSFWLVDNLTAVGRIDEAMDLYESLCGRASSLGLFSEQIDPVSGSFLGNFPQALSHIGAISSGFNLARAVENLNDEELTPLSTRPGFAGTAIHRCD